jgi:hypothetical protein
VYTTYLSSCSLGLVPAESSGPRGLWLDPVDDVEVGGHQHQLRDLTSERFVPVDGLPVTGHGLALLHLINIQEIFRYMEGNFDNFSSVTFRRPTEKSTSLIPRYKLLFSPIFFHKFTNKTIFILIGDISEKKLYSHNFILMLTKVCTINVKNIFCTIFVFLKKSFIEFNELGW